VGVTDAGGVLRERLRIDFDAMTITAEAPVAVYSFAGGAIGDFATALNAALAATTPAGSANFSNGVLSMNVGAAGGLIVQQEPSDPSARAGRGFAHFFGLNDLVSRPTPIFFENGVDGADLHGLAAGGDISYRVHDSMGRLVAERTISITGALAGAGADWDDVVAALNAPATGLGGYGVFALDPATGRISLTPAAGFELELVADTTQRGSTGVSFSSLHGLSVASTAARATELRVNAQITADPIRLALGRPDLTAALGDRVIEGGDNRGASALLAARDSVRNFPTAGVLAAQSTTLASYAARLGGEAGRMAAGAQHAALGAQAVSAAAADRRAQVEGVSIDDELMKMTSFQNAYAASARVIQAATEMLDVLISLGYRR
jgi:flagellar hook-associated protein 1 FlgK